MPVSQITLAGITGKLGQMITKHILENSQTQVRGFCHNKSKLPSSMLSNSRVKIIEGDSTDLEAARQAVHGSDVVACTYPGDDDLMIDGQKLLIDAAVAENVARYEASDYPIDYTKLKLGQLPSKNPMLHVYNYLQDKPIEGVHVMIGCFTEVFCSYLGLLDPNANTIKCWGTGDEAWELTTYDTAAQYVALIADDQTASGPLKCQFASPYSVAGQGRRKSAAKVALGGLSLPMLSAPTKWPRSSRK